METGLDDETTKELVLLACPPHRCRRSRTAGSMPLHVVDVIDDRRREERIVTVYEPDPDRWSADYRWTRR